jgi:hypothetical protein
VNITHFAASSVPRTQNLLSLGVTLGNNAPVDEQMQTGGCAADFQLSNLYPLGRVGSGNE